jgi:hypothetical protein
MAITRMRFVQEAELGRAVPTRTVRDNGRHCPMHVDAAPEARTLIALACSVPMKGIPS